MKCKITVKLSDNAILASKTVELDSTQEAFEYADALLWKAHLDALVEHGTVDLAELTFLTLMGEDPVKIIKDEIDKFICEKNLMVTVEFLSDDNKKITKDSTNKNPTPMNTFVPDKNYTDIKNEVGKTYEWELTNLNEVADMLKTVLK